MKHDGRRPDMKLLLLNGSPKKSGTVAHMLQEIEQEAVARGIKIVRKDITDLTVRPCTGCMSCRKNGFCRLPEDDAQHVLQELTAADALVVGAPCYWGNIPGQFKILFDRIVYGLIGDNSGRIPRPLHKGKRAVIVATSTTPYPFNILFRQSRGAVNALREILRHSGFRITAEIEKGGTDRHPDLTEKEIKRCRRAVVALFPQTGNMRFLKK